MAPRIPHHRPLDGRLHRPHVPRAAAVRALAAGGLLLVALLAAGLPGSLPVHAAEARIAVPAAASRTATPSGAYVATTTRLDPHVVDIGVHSPAMRATMPVRLILPPGWSAGSGRTYPVFYLLQGASDDYTSWTRETDIETLAAHAQVIVATPEGGRAGFYTDWWNGGRGGGPNWETFHTVELPQVLRTDFHAGSRQAVIGISEGGLGALDYAARHRGAYVFAGSFSGVVDLDDGGLRAGVELTCAREGVDWRRLWGDPVRDRKVWEAHNPAHLVDRFRGVRVYLSAAAGMPGTLATNAPPEAGLLEAPTYQPTLRFAASLRRAGVAVTSHLYLSGTHAWPYWQRELHLAWPAVLNTLRATR